MPDETDGGSERLQESNGPEELMKQLNAQPVSEVSGVVGPRGAGGAISTGEELWTLTVCFPAWKPARELPRTQELIVRKLVTDHELDALRSFFKPYEVVRFRARLAERSVFGRPDALLVEMIGGDSADTELNQIAQQLREPVILESVDFGRFTLDKRVNWFQADTTWGSIPVKLHLSMDDSEKPDELLALARSLWDLQPIWDQRIKDFAVAELLNLKNEGWLQEDEKELSPEEFKQRMTLESITVYPNAHFEFCFDDGDLFWGHLIMVAANLTDGPTEAGIHG